MNEAGHIRVTNLRMVSEKCPSTTCLLAGGTLDHGENNFLHCLPLSFVKRDNSQRIARAAARGNALHFCDISRLHLELSLVQISAAAVDSL
jgi:hypothetical protein